MDEETSSMNGLPRAKQQAIVSTGSRHFSVIDRKIILVRLGSIGK